MTSGARVGWTRRALAVVALCFVINMVDGVDVTVLSYIGPRLQRDWTLTALALGYLFSAGLVGMALGALVIAPLADRRGRRRVILAALLLMSGGMLAGGLAGSWAMLAAGRVVVGSGIGAALAVMAAQVAEVAPPYHRHLAVGLIQAGYPLAAVATGFVVAAVLPAHGWHVVLGGAGVLSLLLWPAAAIILPQARSDRRGADAGRIGDLLAGRLARTTLLLWLAVFAGLMVLYFVVSWIPRLAIVAGLAETDAIVAGALYNLGAFCGTVAMSLAAARVAPGRLVAAMLGGAALAMMAFATLRLGLPATLTLAFGIGVLLQGGYNAVWPLVAASYPAAIRATGTGWAMGLGRAGAVVGPWLGGALLNGGASLPVVFAVFCVPLLVCAAAAFAVSRRA